MKNKRDFAGLVKVLAKEKKITITQIAERIGISQSWLSGMLLYRSDEIPMRRVQEILNALDEDLELVNGKKPRFSDYKTDLKSFRRIMESMDEELKIKLSNGKTYNL